MSKLVKWLKRELCGFPFGTHQMHATIYGKGEWLHQCMNCGWVLEDTRRKKS